MADETLKAFELGASLYDRAQTQKRMMEQLQVQTAESLLQRQGMELQNKIRDNELSSAIGERQAQVDEYNTFSTLGKQVSDYLNNPKPDAKFPVVPPFKSKTYRLEADKMLNNLEKYSARAELLKTQEKARTDSISKQTEVLKAAMQIPGAVDIDPQTETPKINWTVYNAGRQRVFDADVEQKQARTTAIGSNIKLSRDKLNELIRNNASDAEIAQARLAVDKSFKEARVQLDQEELAEKKLSGQEQRKLNQEKFDFTKGVQIRKLDIEELDLAQRQKRTDAYVENLLRPLIQKDIKLNTFDDSFVRKEASVVSNQQFVSDAIEKTMKVLEDPYVSESVKIKTAQLLAKDLNDPRGRDAVSNQEADRILGELDIISSSRAWDKGSIADFIGRDLSGFKTKIELVKNNLDSNIVKSFDRVNAIYKKYDPSRGAMITGGTPQATSRTNAPAMSPSMSGTNSLSEISFESTAEARAKGKKTGDFVIIKGVKGNLK
jgi:hypothetical protein